RPASSADSPAAVPAQLELFLVNFVVEPTGFLSEVADLDADLAFALRDALPMKAQLFGELQEYFDVGTATTNLSLDDFPTLRHVLNFLAAAGSGAPPAATAPTQPVAATPQPAPLPTPAAAPTSLPPPLPHPPPSA